MTPSAGLAILKLLGRKTLMGDRVQYEVHFLQTQITPVFHIAFSVLISDRDSREQALKRAILPVFRCSPVKPEQKA